MRVAYRGVRLRHGRARTAGVNSVQALDGMMTRHAGTAAAVRLANVVWREILRALRAIILA
jgi:hypothetical protein